MGNSLKKISTVMLIFAVFFLLMIGIVLTTTFIPLGEIDTEPQMDIYLTSNEIHIGIVVPVANQVMDWNQFLEIGYFTPEARGLQWVEFGWGDRRFYFEMPDWDHFTMGLAADALFLPDPAVMHVNFLESHPTQYRDMRKVKISYKTYQKMVQAIQSEFILEKNKPILIPGKGYSGLDNFFEGRGSYSIIRTCNVWTSDIFARSGLKHPLWSPTKYGLEFIWDDDVGIK